MEIRWLISGLENREMLRDYLGGPGVDTSILRNGREMDESHHLIMK